MKRYWLFAYEHHYPSGGMIDFVIDADNINDCEVKYN